MPDLARRSAPIDGATEVVLSLSKFLRLAQSSRLVVAFYKAELLGECSHDIAAPRSDSCQSSIVADSITLLALDRHVARIGPRVARKRRFHIGQRKLRSAVFGTRRVHVWRRIMLWQPHRPNRWLWLDLQPNR